MHARLHISGDLGGNMLDCCLPLHLVLSCFTLLCILLLSSLSGCITTFFPAFFSFPLPFAFRKTTHRVRRGQTSLWNNNGVVLGKLPMERPA